MCGGIADAISSQGGSSQKKMAVEFPVRAGFTPEAVYVKNLRKPVAAEAPEGQRFMGGSARDNSVTSGRLMGGGGGGASIADSLNTDDAAQLAPAVTNTGRIDTRALGFQVSNSLPRRLTMQRGGEGSLRLAGNEIAGGSSAFDPSQFAQSGYAGYFSFMLSSQSPEREK